MTNDQYLKDIKPEREELESFIHSYSKREALGTRFIPTLEFINQEITDITTALKEYRTMAIEVHISPLDKIPMFNHSFCATKVYETLSRGHDVTVGHVIKLAKAACEEFNRRIIAQYGRAVAGVTVGDTFDQLCMTWIRSGICFMYYIRFLYEKKANHQLTLEGFNTLIINLGDGAFINTGNNANNNASIQINKHPDTDPGNKSGASQ